MDLVGQSNHFNKFLQSRNGPNIKNTDEVLDLHTDGGLMQGAFIWTSMVQSEVHNKHYKHVGNGGQILG